MTALNLSWRSDVSERMTAFGENEPVTVRRRKRPIGG